mgnify:CR=1 FL=1
MLHYYIHAPLVFLIPAEQASIPGLEGSYPKMLPFLADNWRVIVDKNRNVTIVEVTLKKTGWSDGKPVTAKDVYLSKIMYGCYYASFMGYYEVVNDTTIRRYFNGTNIRFETLTSWMWSWDGVWASENYYTKEPLYSVCTKLYDLLKQRYEITQSGGTVPSDLTKTIADLQSQFRGNFTEIAKKEPSYIANGPFYPSKITESYIIWEKNPYFWASDQIKVARWIMYPSPETAVALEQVAAGKITWTTFASVSTDLIRFLNKTPGLLIYSMPNYRMVGILFNEQRYPMNMTCFRRAIAYLIDRDKIIASLPMYAKKPTLNIGLPDQFLYQWLTTDDLKLFTNYTYDPKKAEQELTSCGFMKDPKTKKWVYPNGTPISITILVQPDTMYTVPAEIIAASLNSFGISTQINIQPAAVWTTLVRTYSTSYNDTRDYDLTIWISSLMYATGSPYWTWSHILALGWGAGGAIAFPNWLNISHPWKTCTNDANISDLFSILYNNPGTGIEKCAVKAFAWIVNEYVPVYHIYEYGVWVVMNTNQLQGWPSADDPVWSVRLMDAGYYRALLLFLIYYNLH